MDIVLLLEQMGMWNVGHGWRGRRREKRKCNEDYGDNDEDEKKTEPSKISSDKIHLRPRVSSEIWVKTPLFRKRNVYLLMMDYTKIKLTLGCRKSKVFTSVEWLKWCQDVESLYWWQNVQGLNL